MQSGTNSGRFSGRTVIVTGGGRGMGASHVRGFAAEGANVVIADLLEDEGKALAIEIGDRAFFSKLNVTNETDWADTVSAAEKAFGPVSVLVNNAGIVEFGNVADMELTVWRRLIDVNLTGTFLGMRAVVPSMRKNGGGSIVNISSSSGMMAEPGLAGYAASKWGVRGLSKTAAMELGRDNILVNTVHPGAIFTPMAAAMEPEAQAAYTKHNAIPRYAQCDEITRMVLFIASDECRFSTGCEFVADGGRTMGPVPDHLLA
jgi:3alpha(or 20beta)-hydroxysteroid dehydrogenase